MSQFYETGMVGVTLDRRLLFFAIWNGSQAESVTTLKIAAAKAEAWALAAAT